MRYLLIILVVVFFRPSVNAQIPREHRKFIGYFFSNLKKRNFDSIVNRHINSYSLLSAEENNRKEVRSYLKKKKANFKIQMNAIYQLGKNKGINWERSLASKADKFDGEIYEGDSYVLTFTDRENSKKYALGIIGINKDQNGKEGYYFSHLNLVDRKNYLDLVRGSRTTPPKIILDKVNTEKQVSRVEPSAKPSIVHPRTSEPSLVVDNKKEVIEPPRRGDSDDKIFVAVEQMPEFVGGEDKLFEYLANEIKYPREAFENKKVGIVYITFIVRKSGKITDAKIIRDIGYGCGEEALRVIKQMPNWIPAKNNGEAVSVEFTLPVSFQLNEENKSKKE